MINYVLDASALLAVVRGEPGAEAVEAVLAVSAISIVNIAEVVERMARDGTDRARIERVLGRLVQHARAPDLEIAIDVGLLGPPTRKAGLSLGDRFCLALARREKAVALTADRAWTQVAYAAGVQVEVVR